MLAAGRYHTEVQDRVSTLEVRHPSRKQARVLDVSHRKSKNASMRCSVRTSARELTIGKDSVRRIWRGSGVKPRQMERHMASGDPNFGVKAAGIIALYLNARQHVAVFRVDENAAIKASPAGVERRGFEYYRHGTALLAASAFQSVKVNGKTATYHTSQDFVDSLSQVVALCKPQQKARVSTPNLSARKTNKVAEFLQLHAQLKLAFTPTYSAWLSVRDLPGNAAKLPDQLLTVLT
jgi:hypothetical protein